RATVVIWETGAAAARYEVDVVPDNYEFEQFREALRRDLPGSNVEVTGKGDTLVLTGTVASSDDSRRAEGIAQSRAKTVVNLLKAPPDPEPRQILLQVKFASIDRLALQQVGFNLFSKNGVLNAESSTEQFQSPRFSQLQYSNGNFTNSSSVNFADLLNLFVYRPDLNIGATIKALQANNLLQILAEPNLITLEGTEASFLAGGSFPFPVLTTTSTGGATAPVVTVQFKPFGVQLNFTPTVTPSGAIDLKVAPEVSSLDYANAVTLQGFLIPAISQRRAETEVILKEGESFAIAGLIDNRVTREADKIIGLGNIPILGNLFKTHTDQKSTTELLVVITPHFVRPLSPDEKAKLPDFVEPFQLTVEQQKALAAKGRKKKKSVDPAQPDPGKPEFTGPSGHQEPPKQ
ncbi:MAG: type and secretion system protein, partial [Bryobacterales bacterium]|nr:type and secretion system protein [Bryobacterales bacterium]